ncbi:hypothetical protein EV188_10696 [Actinomycetospora succinea]|uniref:Uncharacterized protein n=1 Tax=Actinomycetospora succinea TaxID=663603 RepID=A0A4R6V1T3_9PSEU|nr:hypothetical protein [Actinomycetospora succinea]TDQ53950.1 hypothetical protein EV188_10696 [Actinomycetospora succinea]
MYEVDPLDEAVGTLPEELSADFLEVRTALERSPWTVGRPWVATNPTGLRTVTFGAGRAVLVFGIIDRECRVFLVSLVIT